MSSMVCCVPRGTNISPSLVAGYRQLTTLSAMGTIRRLRIFGQGEALSAQPRPTTEAIMATPMRHVLGRLCLAAAAVLFAGATWAQTQAGAQASGQGAVAADPSRTRRPGSTAR